jgi:hypothetical protein
MHWETITQIFFSCDKWETILNQNQLNQKSEFKKNCFLISPIFGPKIRQDAKIWPFESWVLDRLGLISIRHYFEPDESNLFQHGKIILMILHSHTSLKSINNAIEIGVKNFYFIVVITVIKSYSKLMSKS